jgi:prepilin-type N-terminal cleavage/methylation domain-containing protein
MGRNRGFTLIELLVVIAIIAILAAILFPVFAQARAKARAISCLSGVKQFGTAAMMYAQDFDERFPAFYIECKGCRPNAQYNPQTGWEPNGYYWHELVLPYIKNEQILLCPEAQANLTPFCLPYGWNQSWLDFRPIADVEYPAETIMISDGRGRPTAPADRKYAWCKWNNPCADCIEQGKYIYAHQVHPGSAYAKHNKFGELPVPSVDLYAGYPPSERHFGNSSTVLVDGHAKAMKFREISACNNWWDRRGKDGPCRTGYKAGD